MEMFLKYFSHLFYILIVSVSNNQVKGEVLKCSVIVRKYFYCK